MSSREEVRVRYKALTKKVAMFMIKIQNGEIGDKGLAADRERFKKELLEIDSLSDYWIPDDSRPHTFQEDFLKYSIDAIPRFEWLMEELSREMHKLTSCGFPGF